MAKMLIPAKLKKMLADGITPEELDKRIWIQISERIPIKHIQYKEEHGWSWNEFYSKIFDVCESIYYDINGKFSMKNYEELNKLIAATPDNYEGLREIRSNEDIIKGRILHMASPETRRITFKITMDTFTRMRMLGIYESESVQKKENERNERLRKALSISLPVSSCA